MHACEHVGSDLNAALRQMICRRCSVRAQAHNRNIIHSGIVWKQQKETSVSIQARQSRAQCGTEFGRRLTVRVCSGAGVIVVRLLRRPLGRQLRRQLLDAMHGCRGGLQWLFEV